MKTDVVLNQMIESRQKHDETFINYVIEKNLVEALQKTYDIPEEVIDNCRQKCHMIVDEIMKRTVIADSDSILHLDLSVAKNRKKVLDRLVSILNLQEGNSTVRATLGLEHLMNICSDCKSKITLIDVKNQEHILKIKLLKIKNVGRKSVNDVFEIVDDLIKSDQFF